MRRNWALAKYQNIVGGTFFVGKVYPKSANLRYKSFSVVIPAKAGIQGGTTE
jgi:hypothetical protein